MRFYKVLGLIEGVSYFKDNDNYKIIIDHPLNETAYNDKELKMLKQSNYYIYISGGGTCLIDNKYLLLVRRSKECEINPNKLSLFTGRSDNTIEHKNPSLLIRELEEELIISQKFNKEPIKYTNESKRLKISNKNLCVIYKQKIIFKRNVLLSINERDINIINIFKIDMSLDEILAIDGESRREGGGREIIAYNIIDDNYSELKSNYKQIMEWQNLASNKLEITGIGKDCIDSVIKYASTS